MSKGRYKMRRRSVNLTRGQQRVLDSYELVEREILVTNRDGSVSRHVTDVKVYKRLDEFNLPIKDLFLDPLRDL